MMVLFLDFGRAGSKTFLWYYVVNDRYMFSDLHERFRIRKGKTDPRRLAILALFLFAQPSQILLISGTVLVVLAVLLHGWAAGYLARAGYESRETELTICGPYRFTRHPYYLAHLIMDLGFFLIAGLWPFYVIYVPFLFSVYRRNVRKEEKFLLDEFGEEYEQYINQVPRWFVRFTPAPASGHLETFTWEDYMINDEWKRSLSHVLIVIFFWGIFVFGNPFSFLSLLTKLSIILAVTTWLLLRDTRLQTERNWSFQPLWLIAGLAVGLPGIYALSTNHQFWTFIPYPLQIFFIISGSIFAILGITRNIPPIYQQFRAFFDDVFPSPDFNYFFLFSSGGLFTLTLGGLWIGLLMSLMLWSVQATWGKNVPWPDQLFTLISAL